MQKESRDVVMAALDENLYGLGAELAKDHLQLYPKDGIVWIEMGRTLTVLSRFEEAENAFDRAFEFAHETLHEVIFSDRGAMLKRQGKLLEAEEWYRKAIEANPQNPGNYVFLGVAAFRRGDLALAEQIHRQGIACTGECVDESYANLGGVLVALERYDEALECFQKAIELDPDYKWAKLRLRDVKKILKLRGKKTG